MRPSDEGVADEPAHDIGNRLHRNPAVHAVQIVEIDVVRSQVLQRPGEMVADAGLDPVGALGGVSREVELGRQRHRVAEALHGVTEQLLVVPGAVKSCSIALCGVEEGAAGVVSRADRRDRLLLGRDPSVAGGTGPCSPSRSRRPPGCPDDVSSCSLPPSAASSCCFIAGPDGAMQVGHRPRSSTAQYRMPPPSCWVLTRSRTSQPTTFGS